MSEELELLNPKDLSESLNGFDQIAIRNHFAENLDTLGNDPVMFMRALYFVHLRRNKVPGEKVSDGELFKQSMNLSMTDLMSKFETGPDTELDDSAVSERDTQYAEFVIGTGLSFTVDQFMALTLQQRGAIITAANKTR